MRETFIKYFNDLAVATAERSHSKLDELIVQINLNLELTAAEETAMIDSVRKVKDSI